MKLISYLTYKLANARREYKLATRADEMESLISNFEQYLYGQWKWTHDKDWDVYDTWCQMLNEYKIDPYEE